jgi:hypothetical protein
MPRNFSHNSITKLNQRIFAAKEVGIQIEGGVS